MKPIDVTPPSMQAAGQTLTGLAQDMASGLQGLAGTIQGDGNPWGSDDQGSVFGQLYQVVLGKAFTSIDSHVQQVGYAGQALTAQAALYTQAETGMTQQFDAMRSEG